MKKAFIKMHGLGNDFAIFDGRREEIRLTSVRIQALADRHTGIGFDQMVIIDLPRSPETDAFLRIYNADGSEVGACGNATRCIGKLLMAELGKSVVVLETIAAKLAAKYAGDKICVDMGEAHLKWREIPLTNENKTDFLPISEGGLKQPVAVGMGNPHAVFFVEDAIHVPLETLGPRIEHHPLFPERTNVEVAQVISPTEIRMRVWERGAGITQACGTGACATAVAGVRRGLTERKVTVILDGGALEIEWRESDGHVLMTGDAVEVYRGEVSV
ncbi:MAG: diaminopimelate epimerase [Alphaproteobacteria bacterium]|nr:diaminopimelate epimerase [Alphaproteobacteria bacterium]